MKSPPPQLQRLPLQRLSVVIPARDEEGCVVETVRQLAAELNRAEVPHEIVVVDDGSTDQTWALLTDAVTLVPTLRPVQNPGPHGFGRAIVYGLAQAHGDALIIMMADASDDPRDAVRYWRKLQEGYDGVFGSRFIPGGDVIDYPVVKRVLNRLANTFIRLLFRLEYNDTTNAFKAYRRSVIEGCQPLTSAHFNLTVELPLKAMVRGFSWSVVPISWRNRRTGLAKFKIREMGSRYLSVCLELWREKNFGRRASPTPPG